MSSKESSKGLLSKKHRSTRQLGIIRSKQNWMPSCLGLQVEITQAYTAKENQFSDTLQEKSLHRSKSHTSRSDTTRSLRSASFSSFDRPSLARKSRLAPSRPQSSLGFARSNWSTTPDKPVDLSPPQGFDLAAYVRSRRSAKGIQIGRNGQVTNDEFFEEYLLQCEEEVNRSSCSDVEENGGQSLKDLNLEEKSNTHTRRRHEIPLCWEDQLSKTEPNNIKCTNTRSSDPQRNKYSSLNSNKMISRVAQKDGQLVMLKEKVAVEITVGELNSSPIATLHHSYNTGPALTPHGLFKLTIPTAVYDQDEPSNRTSNSPLAATNIDNSEQKSVRNKITFPVDDVSPTQTQTEYLSSGFEDMHFEQPNVLQIWLSSKDHSTQEELEKQTYDVFLTSYPSSLPSSADPYFLQSTAHLFQSSTKAITNQTAQRLTDCLSVIRVDLGDEYLHQEQIKVSSEVKVTVSFGRPRCMFFTARLASLFTSQSGSKLPSNRPEIPNSMENEVLEKFYLRRTSYCNQEDDEDRTDMEVVSEYFPDLKLSSIVDEEEPYAYDHKQKIVHTVPSVQGGKQYLSYSTKSTTKPYKRQDDCSTSRHGSYYKLFASKWLQQYSLQ